jgi:hypothetical protein
MADPVNTARGEISLKIDDVDLVIAATMAGLAAVSRALQCKSLVDLWQRLDGVEVEATLAAIEFLTVKGDWASAIKKIQLKHFKACQVAFKLMIAAHLDVEGNDDAVEDKTAKTAKQK